jgi:hypothetical protein
MMKSIMVMDMPLNDKEEIKLCGSCVLGKNHRQPYPTNAKASRSKKVIKFFHLDICGLMSVNSLSGVKYYVIFFNNFNGYQIMFCIKNKTKVMECFKKVKSER